jgi:Na+/H+ antiporter NhaD/arsenite permease-like protein
VGGLGFIGYLELLSEMIYIDMGPTFANAAVGILSAIVDNIPVMFAVLSMNPDMSLGHWLLVTLTAGVGGSLLSIGSAAGVALMGQAQGRYTFFGHLKWAPVILLGYAASILTHMLLNSAAFQLPPPRAERNIAGLLVSPPAGARHRRRYAPGQLHPGERRVPRVPRCRPE